MVDDKIFDVKKVKVEPTPVQTEPTQETPPSPVKLHLRFFDWHTLAYILFGLAIILAFVAAALTTRYFVISKQAKKTAAPSSQSPVDDGGVAIAPGETKLPTDNPFQPPEPPATAPPPTSAEKDKKTIKIRVLNGNGITGDAAKAKKQLEDAGFLVSSTGNASRQNYSTTQVYYIAGKKSEAELVNEALKAAGRNSALEEASKDLVGADNQVLVVTGKK